MKPIERLTEKMWCYFRCLVQACYREVRHIGPSSDHEARCAAPVKFAGAAIRCRNNREVLRGLNLWKQTGQARTTAEVITPYANASGLVPEQLLEVFALPMWQPSYGGQRWKRIAEVMVKLRDAIDEGDIARAEALCEVARNLHHNSGPLVPGAQQWQANPWQREKWPELCP